LAGRLGLRTLDAMQLYAKWGDKVRFGEELPKSFDTILKG
jgi:hypothetical protein